MAEGYVPVDDDDEADTDDNHHHRYRNASFKADREPLFPGTGIIFDQEHDEAGVTQELLDPVEYEDLNEQYHLQNHHHEQPTNELRDWSSMWLAYQSIGAIYGDIGTSPLYVFSAVFVAPPETEDLLGALSLIIWSLLLIATVKYVGIVLCANDHGEGGSFALLSLIRRHVRLDWRDLISDQDAERDFGEKPLRPFNAAVRNTVRQSPIARRAVTLFAVLGVCMVMSDGVITPAQSILGAVQGIKIAAPDMSTNAVVGVACVLIVVLFAIQPFGTSRLSKAFAPIVLVWLLFNASFGIYNLIHFDHTILRAFSPMYAVDFMVRHKFDGWRSLGGVLLAVTGVEALFADLGAFSVKAIRVSWLGFALPCLLMTYCGQTAFISDHPDAITNPLFQAVPPGMYWPTLVLSMLASIVASQAMLTGTFQLISQAIRTAYLPKIRAVHTSKRVTSQIYVPLANWLMMGGALAVTGIFKTTTRIGNVYGVCVIGVGFITTWLVTLVALMIWNVHFLIVVPIFLFIGFIDIVFLSAALAKVPAGGWFTVLLAATLTSTLLLWSYGEGRQWKAQRDDSSTQKAVITAHDGRLFIRDGKAEYSVKNIRGIGVFLIEPDSRSPPVFDHFIKKFEAVHEVSVLLVIKRILRYSVPTDERFTLSKTEVTGLFQVTLRYGYGDTPSWDSFEQSLTDELGLFQANKPEGDPEPLEGLDESISRLSPSANAGAAIPLFPTAYSGASQKPITYVVGRDKLYMKEGSNFIRRIFLRVFIYLKGHEKTKLSRLNVPVDRLVEVGFSKAI